VFDNAGGGQNKATFLSVVEAKYVDCLYNYHGWWISPLAMLGII